MFYIKLTSKMKLEITTIEPIYRGENLNQKILYLIPKFLKDVDVLTSYVYLNYIRADGVADVVVLERLEDEYNEDYYQYTFPVTNKLTKYPGQICTWLHIFSGAASRPIVTKSGECILQVQESKSMDAYLEDNYLTALHQIHRGLDLQMTKVGIELSGKADGIEYNDGEDTLQLTSNGEPVGEPLNINETVEDVMTELNIYDVVEFDEEGVPDDGSLDDSVIQFNGPHPYGKDRRRKDLIEFGAPTPRPVEKPDDSIIEFRDPHHHHNGPHNSAPHYNERGRMQRKPDDIIEFGKPNRERG